MERLNDIQLRTLEILSRIGVILLVPGEMAKSKLYLMDIKRKQFIIKEHIDKHDDFYRFDLIPFFGDMGGFTKAVFKSFDEYIKYDLKEVHGRIKDKKVRARKIKNKESSAFLILLKKHAREVERKAWRMGKEPEWFKYVFLFENREEFWSIVRKFSKRIEVINWL